jgi:hypothetical protein
MNDNTTTASSYTCPACGATEQDDLCCCRECGGTMCDECGSMPEGICNVCGAKLAKETY